MNYKMTPAQVQSAIREKLSHIYGVSAENASDDEFYKASALVVRDLLVRGRDEFVREAEKQETKQIYYLCMEFLLGRSLKNQPFSRSTTGLPQFGQTPIILFFISAFAPFAASVVVTSEEIISLISVIKVSGSISPRSICSSFVSQSAVISGDWISSGITVMRAFPLSVGSSTLVFLVPLRSRKPFCTSFSMVAALVAGVPIP